MSKCAYTFNWLSARVFSVFYFFFFQAEDGIRDLYVTGVQTCALPICIVNISSIGGKVSVPHLVPYSASKFALVGLSKGLRAELMKDGIKVTTVCPGLMRTGSPRNADFKGQDQFEYAWFSISDALPLLTVSAEYAARQIVRACKRGDAELVISVPAKIAVLFDALFPEAMSQMLALTNRLLPDAGGVGTERRKGRESASSWSPSWLTTLNEEAALRNNEVVH